MQIAIGAFASAAAGSSGSGLRPVSTATCLPLASVASTRPPSLDAPEDRAGRALALLAGEGGRGHGRGHCGASAERHRTHVLAPVEDGTVDEKRAVPDGPGGVRSQTDRPSPLACGSPQGRDWRSGTLPSMASDSKAQA